jgi:hypothetical protein
MNTLKRHMTQDIATVMSWASGLIKQNDATLTSLSLQVMLHILTPASISLTLHLRMPRPLTTRVAISPRHQSTKHIEQLTLHFEHSITIMLAIIVIVFNN